MSEKLGPLYYGTEDNSPYSAPNFSSKTAGLIDEEVRLIVENAHQRAKQILTENREQLEVLAKNLLEYETLTGAEIRALVNGEKIDRTHNDSPKPPTRSSVPSSRKPIITMGENPLPA